VKVLREGPLKITKATIDAAWRRRARGQRLVVQDQACPGLALIIGSTGMTWTYSYKPRGVDSRTGKRWGSRSVTIGNPDKESPDDARAEAGRLKGHAKAGNDPAAERKAKIAAASEARSRTLDRIVEDYVKEIPKRAKMRGKGRISDGHAREEASHVRAAVVAMQAGAKPIGAIDGADLRKLLRAHPEHPNAARHRFGAINRFFDWCIDERLLVTNPCTIVARSRRPRAPASRADYLKLNELAQLWHAVGNAEGLEEVHRDLVRFLIAVPCRRGEATHMEWQHVDLDVVAWSQPGHTTKNGDPHRLHLHPMALCILRDRHEAAGKPKSGLVFPAPRSRKAIDTFTDIKAALLVAAPDLPGWRLHDMRRSFVSSLAKAGMPEVVADAVLNHRQAATRGGVLGVYQRESHWPEQIKAMQLWGRLLSGAVAGDQATNIVTLHDHVAGGVTTV
jgi:integrase